MERIATIPIYSQLHLWGRDDFKNCIPTVSDNLVVHSSLMATIKSIWDEYDYIIATKIVAKNRRTILSSHSLSFDSHAIFREGAGYFANSDLPYLIKSELVTGYNPSQLCIYRAYLL